MYQGDPKFKLKMQFLSCLTFALFLTDVSLPAYAWWSNRKSGLSNGLILESGDLKCAYFNTDRRVTERALKCQGIDCVMVKSHGGSFFKSESSEWTCIDADDPLDTDGIIYDCKIKKSRFKRFFGGKKYQMSCKFRFHVGKNYGPITAQLIQDRNLPCPDKHSRDDHGLCVEDSARVKTVVDERHFMLANAPMIIQDKTWPCQDGYFKDHNGDCREKYD